MFGRRNPGVAERVILRRLEQFAMAFDRVHTLFRRTLAVIGGFVALAAVSADAQGPSDTARGSVLLDQRNAEFGLQLRQWQQMHEIDRASGGDPTVRREMQMQHLQQHQRQDALHSRQLQEFDSAVSRTTITSGAGEPEAIPPGITRFPRERAEQALHQDYELDELARRVKATPKEEVPRWGPTLTEPLK